MVDYTISKISTTERDKGAKITLTTYNYERKYYNFVLE